MKKESRTAKILARRSFIFSLLVFSGIYFSSCGPSDAEMKKMQDQAQRTFDSLAKEANKKLEEDRRKMDSAMQNVSPSPSINK